MIDDPHGMHKVVKVDIPAGVWSNKPWTPSSSPLRPVKLTSTMVPKGWGHELHICNNDEFCGKELHIKAGHRFSIHFHIKKREVFRLRSGSVALTTINLEDASQLIQIMQPGDVFEIPRHLPHSIRAVEDSLIDEYSTTHYDEDSYRVAAGSSQQKS